MNRTFSIAIGSLWTLGLIVCGLWGWQRAEAIVSIVGWEKRTIGVWSVRCAAVALVAAAQAILLTLVVNRIYRPDALGGVVRLSAGLVFAVCVVSAIALGLAGR